MVVAFCLSPVFLVQIKLAIRKLSCVFSAHERRVLCKNNFLSLAFFLNDVRFYSIYLGNVNYCFFPSITIKISIFQSWSLNKTVWKVKFMLKTSFTAHQSSFHIFFLFLAYTSRSIYWVNRWTTQKQKERNKRDKWRRNKER